MDKISHYPRYLPTELSSEQIKMSLLLAAMVLERMREGDDDWKDWFNQATETLEIVVDEPYTASIRLYEAIKRWLENDLRETLAGEQFPPHSPWGKSSCIRVEITEDTAIDLFYNYYNGQFPYFTLHRDQVMEWVGDDPQPEELRKIKATLEKHDNIEYWIFYND